MTCATGTAGRPLIEALHDSATGSLQYVVADARTGACAIIDPVLDFDETCGTITTRNADALLATVRERGWQVEWVIDTHPHADHLSAADYLRTETGARTATGDRISEVQALWKVIYNLQDLHADGRQWDELLRPERPFQVGSLPVRVLRSPGHTLSSVTLVIGDAAFVHDTLFMPDSGTARTDFPGGSASSLWASIQEILSLPPHTRLFCGHDYRPGGRVARWESSVEEQRASNVHLKGCKDGTSYVAFRTARDLTLPLPRLMLHALQVNIRAGQLPPPEINGTRYLKLPLDPFRTLETTTAPWCATRTPEPTAGTATG